MSTYGYLNAEDPVTASTNIVSDINANLLIDNSNFNLTVSASCNRLIENGTPATFHFSILVPKSIGFYKFDWNTILTEKSLDVIGYVVDGKYTEAENTLTSLTREATMPVFTMVDNTGSPDFLFQKLDVSVTLTATENTLLRKIIIGYSSANVATTLNGYNMKMGLVKFDIFPSLDIS